ncbi:MAG: glycerophosphodiester phosphodiesterase family protein [Vicinamibacterales bacterium]|jgi:glycerophosphoryl diester phosphodiesterase|nr:glycerophosphodiester phosphodiesterase [Acidobacteriota bacterium]MDP7294452.1 glycerophosphodiester phosphodiesterase family protein [Vicinamibacterales bacterium]MDP7672541.1 glycerophosphodiester phosphodiesterase family protein [Vicinamibacterales bacterium]HJO39740.1 glycerophosphodiester phosphodiesterase family protein [Vicinamibacterales bacterium]|tara:strand:+ start:849 stop:1793 length:945 start_codon:yes stop_codon:yes gene_type:complete
MAIFAWPRRRLLAGAVVAFGSVPLMLAQSNEKTLIAHRGASAYAPEHTLAAYRLAIEQGADYVEQDLGVTRDGALICLHDTSLERTTNVRSIFPGRFVEERVTGGRLRQRWRVRDFTLAEIKQLDAGGWFGDEFAGVQVPSWQEAIDFIRGDAGLFPELKSPAAYDALGIDMVALVADTLRRNGLDMAGADPATPVILQSFDENSLRQLAEALPTLPRVFLVAARDPRAEITNTRLREIATFASGIGPAKAIVAAQPDLVDRAHRLGLTVTPYTFNANATGRFPTMEAEMRHFLFTLGVDALFTDNPDRFPRTP